jgi:hypothetical protein
LAAKLAVLVRGIDAEVVGEKGSFPGGATLVDRDRGRAWVYVEDEPARGLGRALAWARQQHTAELSLVVEEAAGLLARRASQFAPPPSVWWVRGDELHPVEPEPLTAPPPPDPRALALAPMIERAGAEVVVEHGVVAGEVFGLEVARVVLDEHGTRIEVGVGRHDREAFTQLHGDLPTDAALAEVVATVRRHRVPEAVHHPLHRLAAERWLRGVVIDHPALVGARRLDRVEGTVPRTNLKEPVPAAAIGEDLDRGPVVAVCSVGVDLDLVPTAADVRLARAPEARLVLVVPARDDVAVTRWLAGALARPAEVVAVDGDWRARPVP